jgi:hypothetical protein
MSTQGSSILNFNRTNSAPQAGEPVQQREAAQFWLNIGYFTEIPNSQTGELEPVFISLPFGIALDTMTRKSVERVSGFKLKLAVGANKLLDNLLAAGVKLEPGESKVLDIGEQSGLALELRRVKGNSEVPVAEAEAVFRDFTF